MTGNYREIGKIHTNKKINGNGYCTYTCLGSFGLFYISPRTAIPLLVIDLPLMLLLALSLLLRPLVVSYRRSGQSQQYRIRTIQEI